MTAIELFLCLTSSGVLVQALSFMRWAAKIETRVAALEAAQ
jgi:hypothetical protein